MFAFSTFCQSLKLHMADEFDSFHRAWLRRWVEFHDEGSLFRSSVADWQTRELEGTLRLWARYHPEFFEAKRKTTENHSVDEPPCVPVQKPFNHVGFNFNKADPREILVYMEVDVSGSLGFSMRPPVQTDSSMERELVVLVLNPSPQFHGHGLLVPKPAACTPQVINKLTMFYGLCLLSVCSRADMRLGYNSLGAFASVNHLHMHLTFFEDLCRDGQLLVETCKLQPLCAHNVDDCDVDSAGEPRQQCVALAELPEWPCRTFVLYIVDCASIGDRQLRALACAAEALLTQLAALGHPHNILFSPATAWNEVGQHRSPRIFIWPRQNQSQNTGPLQAWSTLSGVAYCK